MFRMRRSFLPVGQGAFYLERSFIDEKEINVVYDCGSINQKYIDREIDAAFINRTRIDAVYISHFDNDHVSGLKKLLQRFDVKNVFLPLVERKNRYLSLMAGSIENHGNKEKVSMQELEQFVNSPSAYIREVSGSHSETRVILVEAYNTEKRHNIETSFEGVNESNTIIVPSGKPTNEYINDELKISDAICGWTYTPYNIENNNKRIRLEEELSKTLGKKVNLDIITQDEIKNLITHNFREIKEAYKKLPGGLNSNSLVLFSGSKSDGLRQYRVFGENCFKMMCRQRSSCSICRQELKNGCLYLGDFDASNKYSWNTMCAALGSLLNYAGCIQIPHHGSKNSYCTDIALLGQQADCIISVGENSQYGHPSSDVLLDMLKHEIFAIVVTENQNSRADYYIK